MWNTAPVSVPPESRSPSSACLQAQQFLCGWQAALHFHLQSRWDHQSLDVWTGMVGWRHAPALTKLRSRTDKTRRHLSAVYCLQIEHKHTQNAAESMQKWSKRQKLNGEVNVSIWNKHFLSRITNQFQLNVFNYFPAFYLFISVKQNQIRSVLTIFWWPRKLAVF